MASEVTILPFEETLSVEPGESVLSAILRQQRFVKYGCKHGGCSTCRAEVIDGDYTLSDNTSFSLSEADRDAGIVLLCSTYVEGDLTVDVSQTMDDLDDVTYRAGLVLGEYDGVVDRREMLSDDIVSLGLRLPEEQKLTFVPGQYLEVEIPGSADQWRSFSLANAPGDHHRVDLIIRIIPDGAFGTALRTGMELGSSVRIRGPQGAFAIRWSHRPMVMVAGGSGIAPIWAMVADLIAQDNRRAVTFFYGGRTTADLIYRERLEALAAEHDWFSYVPAISDPGPDDAAWAGERGLITDVVARHLPRTRGHEAYLCGPPPMIDAAEALLIERGMKPQHVYCDRFVPSG